MVDLLIIGAGAAGMAAAVSARENGVDSVLLVDRNDALGGILPQCIHNGFGLGRFHTDLTGPEYAGRYIELLHSSGAEVRLNTFVLSLGQDKSAVLSGPGGVERIHFRGCIMATGCRERPIGALPVAGTRPAGIFTAGAAQKMVNLGGYGIGQNIVILGSGDIGMIMARRFTLRGCRVIAMVEQARQLGGLVRNQRNCIEKYQIPVITSATVTEIHGLGRISAVTVKHLDTGSEELIPCDTLVTAVGLIPERELAAGLGRQPPWLRLCGNCESIHEIVDAVSAQAQAVGRDMAAFLAR